MNVVYCEKCGGYAPEGYALCPPCMREAGVGEQEVQAAAELMDVVNIINMGETDASRRAAIESILRIKNRLEEKDHAEKEAQAQAEHETRRHCPPPRD